MNEKMERLLTILQDVNDEIDFAHERHMVDDGLIDSLELMKIIVALEEAYDVRIDAGEVEPENFNSAEAILALVNRIDGRQKNRMRRRLRAKKRV